MDVGKGREQERNLCREQNAKRMLNIQVYMLSLKQNLITIIANAVTVLIMPAMNISRKNRKEQRDCNMTLYLKTVI